MNEVIYEVERNTDSRERIHRRLSAETEGQSKDQEKPAMPRMHRGR